MNTRDIETYINSDLDSFLPLLELYKWERYFSLSTNCYYVEIGKSKEIQVKKIRGYWELLVSDGYDVTKLGTFDCHIVAQLWATLQLKRGNI